MEKCLREVFNNDEYVSLSTWWKCGGSSIWGKCLIMMNMLGEVPDGSVEGAVYEESV